MLLTSAPCCRCVGEPAAHSHGIGPRSAGWGGRALGEWPRVAAAPRAHTERSNQHSPSVT